MIALMMEAANTSEVLVNLCQTTRRNRLEDTHHIRCREKLRSQLLSLYVSVFYRDP
jgi:hypothetical protein